MRKALFGTLIVAALGTLMLVPAAFGYSGTLTYGQGQLIAPPGTSWANAMTTLYWEVVQNGNLFEYKYILTVPEKNISHFIIETSENVVLGQDLFGFNLAGGAGPAYDPDTYTASNGNPNIPGSMYGVKFDGVEPGSTSWTVAFTSTRAPVWGDFYAKCGGRDGEINTVYNAGFSGGYFNPTGYVTRDGLATDNLLAVPDTAGAVVPEMSSLVSSLIGLPVVFGYALRRRQIR